jgi:mannose-6-phosphate isomerase-like protein (cupin superfamily)
LILVLTQLEICYLKTRELLPASVKFLILSPEDFTMTNKQNLLNKASTVAEILLTGSEKSCAVPPELWRAALERVQPDPVAGIRHAAISGNAQSRIHVAEIPQKVTCHYHTHGEEIYEVVEGTGLLKYGLVQKDSKSQTIAWLKPIKVSAGDTFTIPEWYAHQLIRSGNEPLTIIFVCPDTHLAGDRFIIDENLLR